MTTPSETPPLVLCLSGHDPTGGAGIQADMETLALLGCHGLSLITAHTVQNSTGVLDYRNAPADWFVRQGRVLLEEFSPRVAKVGMVGSEQILDAILQLLDEYPPDILVVDPVIAGGGGGRLADAGMDVAIRERLVPRTTLLTPNLPELALLTGRKPTENACRDLVALGCKAVLATGTHAAEEPVVNRLYGPKGLVREWRWRRFPHSYHGSGCTLAAAVAAELAKGNDLEAACEKAQGYTMESIHRGWQPGAGQHFLRRGAYSRSAVDPSRGCP